MITRDTRRRSLLVNKSLQYRFLAMILIYSLTIVLFLGALIFVPDFMQVRNEALSLEIRAAVADIVLTKHKWVWFAVIPLVLLLGWHSFREFQRVVGPLYRFRWAFDQVCKGELNFPVKIRKKDYLHKEEESLNEMLGVLKRKLGRIKQTGGQALNSLDSLEKKMSISSEWSENHMEILRTHRGHVEEVVDTASFFRLQDGDDESEDSDRRPDRDLGKAGGQSE